MLTEYVPTDERTGPRYPLLLTTGRILSQYNVGAQTRRTENVVWHEEDRLEINPHDAEQRGVKEGDWVRIASRAGETALRALVTDRVAPGVVYTTFHHPAYAGQRHHHGFLGLGHQLPRIQGDGGAGQSVQRSHHLSGRLRVLLQIEPAHRCRQKRRNSPMSDAAVHTRSSKVTAQTVVSHDRCIPQEVPVAFVYDGSTYAVMMASPSDLENFAVGFSLTEGVVGSLDQIENLDIVRQRNGIELRMWLAHGRGRDLVERRRRMAGPTGCGLCGIESLEAAVQACPRVTSLTRSSGGYADASPDAQPADPCRAWRRLLDQSAGAGRARRGRRPAQCARQTDRRFASQARRTRRGITLLTSRVSVEMVQKAAASGAPIIVAVSAPTALALKTADTAGITLVAVARADGFEVFTHPARIHGLGRRTAQREGLVEHAA